MIVGQVPLTLPQLDILKVAGFRNFTAVLGNSCIEHFCPVHCARV